MKHLIYFCTYCIALFGVKNRYNNYCLTHYSLPLSHSIQLQSVLLYKFAVLNVNNDVIGNMMTIICIIVVRINNQLILHNNLNYNSKEVITLVPSVRKFLSTYFHDLWRIKFKQKVFKGSLNQSIYNLYKMLFFSKSYKINVC